MEWANVRNVICVFGKSLILSNLSKILLFWLLLLYCDLILIT